MTSHPDTQVGMSAPFFCGQMAAQVMYRVTINGTHLKGSLYIKVFINMLNRFKTLNLFIKEIPGFPALLKDMGNHCFKKKSISTGTQGKMNIRQLCGF